MRKRGVLAAIVAAALFAGGPLAHALTEAPASNWIYQPFAAPGAQDGRGFISAPDLPFLVGAPNVPLGAPYAPLDAPFAASGPLPAGLLSISGDSTAITVPHLLPGGLIDRDGSTYMVRDLELVDRLTGNVAFDLGYDFDLGRRFDPTDVRANPAYAGLFLSPSDWNLSGFGESGFYAGTSLGLGGGVSLNLGGSESGADRSSLLPQILPYPGAATAGVGFDQREAETALAGVDW